MLQRVMIDGIELPRLYIAENKKDAELAKSKGIPFVRWSQGQEALIRMLLRPTLERMFPGIKWNLVLGRKKSFRTNVIIYDDGNEGRPDQVEMSKHADQLADGYEEIEFDDEVEIDPMPELPAMEDEDGVLSEVSDITENERLFVPDDGVSTPGYQKLSIEDYIGDMNSYVNIEMLQRLRLMPAFIGNILDCVKLNIGSGLYWREGYNKRLGIPVGRFDSSGQLPNLVILDVSGSIPRGISATMISLIDTLRTQLSADLIITSDMSRFYPMGAELPSPQTIRNMFGYGNEASQFFHILDHDIKGRHYGHVFSFGDNDCPEYYNDGNANMPGMAGTIVEHVHHYHTWKNCKTGYAKWCHMLSKAPIEDYDKSWCNFIRR